MTWVLCDDEVVVGDIVRFTESVWERRGPKRKQRVVRVGEHDVIAEVLTVEEQWIYLIVMECEGDKPLEKGQEIKRKVKTVLKRCERLLWSEESVRAKLTTRFLKDPEEEEAPKPKKR
jgi:hypothetical protein